MHPLFELGQTAHADVPLTEAQFIDAWAARPSADERYASDVYLAAAIELRVGRALQWLQQQVHRSTRGLEGRIPRQLLDDVESSVLELVAVGTGERPPRIREYAGRGPLLGWLQVIVVRMARARAESPATRVGDSDLEQAILGDLEPSVTGPELHVLRSRFHGELGASLRAAGEQLSERDRTILRLHYVDGVGLHELARAYQVHRATISRWLLAARDAYLTTTRDELSQRTGVERDEVDSLVRSLQSHVELSLRRVFGAE